MLIVCFIKEVISMLRKVENQPIMTAKELKSYYPNNWYRYSVVEGNGWENPHVIELVQVTHLADSREELLDIPEDEKILPGSPGGGYSWGRNINPEPGIQIGGMEFAYL